MNYDVDYFINKFEAIPESLWQCNMQGNEELELKTPHCALGHCRNNEGYLGNALADNSNEAARLVKIIDCLGITNHSANYLLVDINNGDDPRYKEETPRQRVLSALADVKKIQANILTTVL